MADENSNTPAGNSAAVHGDHDRVQMLSLKADGTPDQNNPEIIGDPDVALAATREQYRQQAVSAADAEARRAVVDDEYADAPQDPTVEALQAVHDDATKAADSAAEETISALATPPASDTPSAPVDAETDTSTSPATSTSDDQSGSAGASS